MSPSYNSLFSLYEGEVVAGNNPHCGDIGGTRFFGLLMGQNQHALVAFDTLFKTLEHQNTEPARIIELGTSHGGLSVFLQLYSVVNEKAFTTYDLPDFTPTYHALFELLRVDYRQGNVLNDRQTIDDISQAIAAPGMTLLLCDGGNKALEFNLYSPFLKPGDIILAHDYVPGHDSNGTDGTALASTQDNLWAFREIWDADIEVACQEHSLEPFLQSVFNGAAWLCRRRRSG